MLPRLLASSDEGTGIEHYLLFKLTCLEDLEGISESPTVVLSRNPGFVSHVPLLKETMAFSP